MINSTPGKDQGVALTVYINKSEMSQPKVLESLAQSEHNDIISELNNTAGQQQFTHVGNTTQQNDGSEVTNMARSHLKFHT
jgi:hypothetical protein